MSFARYATCIKQQMPESGILSLEAREHGSTVTTPDNGEILDFSIEALVADALVMIQGVQERMGWTRLPPSVFVGHSLGGAVATNIAAQGSLGAQLVGFQVLDVVEGSAIEALSHMRTYLASRPPNFASVDAAIEWHVRSRTIRDAESARASVPSLLVRGEDGRWKWKTDLKRTERWWEEWFTGMSGKFLKGKAAKALVLAGTDRLDKELMVGQMQGMMMSFHQEKEMILMVLQANSSSLSLLKLGISFRRTCRTRWHSCPLNFSGEMTEALWCYHQRCLIYWLRGRRSDSAHQENIDGLMPCGVTEMTSSIWETDLSQALSKVCRILYELVSLANSYMYK